MILHSLGLQRRYTDAEGPYFAPEPASRVEGARAPPVVAVSLMTAPHGPGRHHRVNCPIEKHRRLSIVFARMCLGMSVRSLARLHDCSERSIEAWTKLAHADPEAATSESLAAWYRGLDPRRRALVLSPLD